MADWTDFFGTNGTAQGTPTTNTAVTAYINGQAQQGTMQSGVFVPNS